MKHKKLLLIIIVLLFIILLFLIPRLRNQIRTNEIDGLTELNYANKTVNSIKYNQAQSMIDNTVSIKIAFVNPSSKVGKSFIEFIDNAQEINNLQGELSIYQNIYTDKKLFQKYNLNNNQVSIIAFENGKATNRIDLKEIPTDSVMLINRISSLQ